MHFWFSKMLWSTKVEISWNIKESIQELTRAHSMPGIWKTIFTKNKTKTAVPEDQTILHASKLKYTDSKYINAIPKEAVFMSGKLQWREIDE